MENKLKNRNPYLPILISPKLLMLGGHGNTGKPLTPAIRVVTGRWRQCNLVNQMSQEL